MHEQKCVTSCVWKIMSTSGWTDILITHTRKHFWTFLCFLHIWPTVQTAEQLIFHSSLLFWYQLSQIQSFLNSMQKQTVLWLVFLNVFRQILSVFVAFWGRKMKQTDRHNSGYARKVDGLFKVTVWQQARNIKIKSRFVKYSYVGTAKLRFSTWRNLCNYYQMFWSRECNSLFIIWLYISIGMLPGNMHYHSFTLVNSDTS